MQDFQPYPYQIHIYDLLLAGKNIILQAPTGAGKTIAALYPFLYCLTEPDHSPLRDKLPRKCIYSVPMRILAKQFFVEYQKLVGSLNRKFATDFQVTIQTGDQPTDRYLTGDLIFATIDQTLSAYLNTPYSLSCRQGNMNAGALMSAYLVFDEFHLFDPTTTLPTTLRMLKDLRGITPFMLMTATFSENMLSDLAQELDAVVVPHTPQQQAWFLDLTSQQKTRRYHNATTPLTADTIWQKHSAIPDERKKSLIICNTVARSQFLYQQLQTLVDDQTRLMLLHSRFLPEDRAHIEDTIRTEFGKDHTHPNSTIAIATQAIEVGVDMSSHVLHTELAPANAILQRAGRCARYKGNIGDVYVYDHAIDPTDHTPIALIESPAPYDAELLALTWQAFQARDGQHLTFADEQALISEVHGAFDAQAIQQLRARAGSDLQAILRIMEIPCSDNPKVRAKTKIRDIENMRVTIHDDPDTLCEHVYEIPAFGLYRNSLLKLVKEWLTIYQESDTLEWAVAYLTTPRDDDAESGTQVTHIAVKITHPDEARDILGSPLVVVNPVLAGYSPELGFLPHRNGSPTSAITLSAQATRSTAESYGGYRLESYQLHIAYVYQAFEEYWHEAAWAAQKLETRYGWEPGSVRRAAQLAVWLHDIGKLSKGWQDWVQRYQAAIDMPVDLTQAYAHTERQSAEHQDIERHLKTKRPHHAVESALVALPIVVRAFGTPQHALVGAVYAAIARHHTPHADTPQAAFELVSDALTHIYAVSDQLPAVDKLPGMGQPVTAAMGLQCAKLIPTGFDNREGAFLAYRLLVRVLRRADSEGTRRGTIKAHL